MDIRATARNIAGIRADAIIVNHFSRLKQPDGEAAAVDKALDGAMSRLIEQGEIKGKLNEITLIHTLGKLPASRVAVVGLGKKKELTADRLRGATAEACRFLRQKGAARVVTTLADTGITPESAAQAATEGAMLGLYTFRRYITARRNHPGEIKLLVMAGKSQERPSIESGIARGKILAEAVNWARDLVNEPANYMTPSRLAEAARQMAGEYGLEAEVLDKEQMETLGMGALLGVAQGSQQPPKFIILKYRGSDAVGTDIALVGKGITFDSGGISIKPSERMSEMKADMAGGASVMAALMALSRLKARINVTALVPAAENLPSGSALKPGDILTAMNGKTIEILNTDAEGRLILSDALSYAGKIGVKNIVDVATLTGACMVALGKVCTGAFGNNQRLMDRVIAASKDTGEHLWQLPMYDEYKEQLKSDVADIKNIGGRYGGAITAAKFLEEFVSRTPWVHLDIAGTMDSDKDKGHLVKGATGIPVRTLVSLVLSLVK